MQWAVECPYTPDKGRAKCPLCTELPLLCFLRHRSTCIKKQTECPELDSFHLKQIVCIGVRNGTELGSIWIYSFFSQTCDQPDVYPAGSGME